VSTYRIRDYLNAMSRLYETLSKVVSVDMTQFGGDVNGDSVRRILSGIEPLVPTIVKNMAEVRDAKSKVPFEVKTHQRIASEDRLGRLYHGSGDPSSWGIGRGQLGDRVAGRDSFPAFQAGFDLTEDIPEPED